LLLQVLTVLERVTAGGSGGGPTRAGALQTLLNEDGDSTDGDSIDLMVGPWPACARLARLAHLEQLAQLEHGALRAAHAWHPHRCVAACCSLLQPAPLRPCDPLPPPPVAPATISRPPLRALPSQVGNTTEGGPGFGWNDDTDSELYPMDAKLREQMAAEAVDAKHDEQASKEDLLGGRRRWPGAGLRCCCLRRARVVVAGAGWVALASRPGRAGVAVGLLPGACVPGALGCMPGSSRQHGRAAGLNPPRPRLALPAGKDILNPFNGLSLADYLEGREAEHDAAAAAVAGEDETSFMRDLVSLTCRGGGVTSSLGPAA
jgi:hypothetical protein